MRAEQMRGQSIETPKDPAELLFDSIMADVRNRKKAGEEISFKTHENYQEWLGLRNKNFEETRTPEQQAQYFSAEKAQAAYRAQQEAQQAEQVENEELDFGHYKNGANDLNKITPVQARIDADQARARDLSREIKGEKLDLIRIQGIIQTLTERLLDYQTKGEVLNEMNQTWFSRAINYLNRERLSNEMEGLGEEIKELFAVLKGDFKLAKPESNEVAKLIESFSELDKHVSSGQLKLEVLGYTANFLVLLAKVGMLASMANADVPKYNAEEKIDRAPVVAEVDGEEEASLAEESRRSESAVDGYRVSAEPVKTSFAESDVDKLKEVFSLTEKEVGQVNNFTEWRHAILEPEYIGKVKKDGTIPSTEKALHVDAGTQVQIAVDGAVLLTDEVKKEKGSSSIWAVLEKNKKAIEKIAKEKGWGNIDILITGNEYKATQSSKEDLEIKSDKKIKTPALEKGPKGKKIGKNIETKVVVGEGLDIKKILNKSGIKIKHNFGTHYNSPAEYDKAILELKTAKVKLMNKALSSNGRKRTRLNESETQNMGKAADLLSQEIGKLEAKKFIEVRGKNTGIKHKLGKDYATEEEYDVAISEMKKLKTLIEDEIVPVMDKEAGAQSAAMLKSVGVIQNEIGRLEAARDAKGVERHQRIIDSEDKIPTEAAPEKIYMSESAKITDLAKSEEIGLRAGRYDGTLSKAHMLLESAYAFSSNVTETEQVNYLAKLKESEGFYSFLLKEGNVDDKFPAKKFLIRQAELGKELALYQIKALEKSIQHKKEEREKVQAEKAALEAQANLKDLNKLLPKEIVDEMKTASKDVESLYISDPYNYIGRELSKISSRLNRMVDHPQTLESLDLLVEEVEKISNDLRLKRNAGKLDIPPKYLKTLDKLDAAIQHSGDLIMIRKFVE